MGTSLYVSVRAMPIGTEQFLARVRWVFPYVRFRDILLTSNSGTGGRIQNGEFASENHRIVSVMKVKVEDAGVTVPKRMLGGADEVEIRSEEGRIVIEPVRSTGADEDPDPVLGLGRDPVSCDAPGASTNHDAYLYGT
ncbi:hypothetical protein GGQ18_002927 [Salinibacter ruber]|uniref:AbrB/MazE/SpoVT family DNA-binding domain-containing protein n=1 Tax=Salinibacter ruber TaxID=146919 RepID=UPI0017E571D3|nr:hypothetical protein [Salinibacter ruber]MBB4070318.1 hypothetical protein [Salinibacter ruber]